MTRKMLIDAAHAEETRVVVLDGSRVEEFDFESQSRRQLRGNIYLARVTRVEPSLQAAFVEFGGNRHGFLAFNEIHPDYYQIPKADREQLVAEEEALLAKYAAMPARRARDEHDTDDEDALGEDAADDADDTSADDTDHGDEDDDAFHAHDDGDDDDAEQPDDRSQGDTDASDEHEQSAGKASSETGGSDDYDDDDEVDALAAELERRRRNFMRKYKIQEVIKRRQVLLVQVVKEERGNKGAALTTYLSLAGRYGVLMPNTARGGGISRKITSATDRKRLKKIVDDLDVQQGMGLIVRTAGAKRTKSEIKRDYDYLVRLWETIRTETFASVAPCLIYEESDLVKRAIRDLYDKEIDTILVEGEQAYREAKEFIRMLMPSHAKKVQPYREASPLFLRHGVEEQLEQIYYPTVQLKSGGYLVINQTEALVAIDVNSGRATKERNIEATALKTNLEAAEEACRQFKLRDLAGLIVIDFIDMEEAKNNRAVEKRFRDAIKDDRARVQVGKISQFGLLELSRQRRRTSLLEGSHEHCTVCDGRGVVRSLRSSALKVLRRIEEEAFKGKAKRILVRAHASVVLYLLNEKRDSLAGLEERYAMRVLFDADETLATPDCLIERLEARPEGERPPALMPSTRASDAEDAAADEAAEKAARDGERDEDTDRGGDTRATSGDLAGDGDSDSDGRKRRRRRRRRRPGEPGEADENGMAADADANTTQEDAPTSENEDTPARGERSAASDDLDEDGKPRRRRRRGRRGGRGRRTGTEIEAGAPTGMEVVDPEALAAGDDGAEHALEDAPEPAGVHAADATDAPANDAPAPDTPANDTVDEPAARAPAKTRARRRPANGTGAPMPDSEVSAQASSSTAENEAVHPGGDDNTPRDVPSAEPDRPAHSDAASDADPDADTDAEETAAVVAPQAQPDPDAAARRARWLDRLKSWRNG